MIRNIKVLKSQYKFNPLPEFVRLLGETIYVNKSYLVYVVDIVRNCPTEISPIDGIRIEKGNIADLDNQCRTMSHIPSELRCHLHDGVEEFFVAKDHRGIQQISWIYSDRHHNRLIALGTREVEIKHCLTMPSYRGRGLYPRVIHAILNYLQAQEVDRVFMCVHPENIPSIRGIEKAGFKQACSVRFRKIFGINFTKKVKTIDMNL